MKVYNPAHIRNVVLLGHSGSGKTTLAETMLFESGSIKRRGSIADKNTVSDYHEIEHEIDNELDREIDHGFEKKHDHGIDHGLRNCPFTAQSE